jgi:hypothetical protein
MEDLILNLKIDEIVVGEEYRNRKVIGSKYAQVYFFPRIGEYSTSKILGSADI